MGVISQNGIDYPVPSVPVQSDGSATDLTNAAVPTGQTIKSYLNSNLPIDTNTYSVHHGVQSYSFTAWQVKDLAYKENVPAGIYLLGYMIYGKQGFASNGVDHLTSLSVNTEVVAINTNQENASFFYSESLGGVVVQITNKSTIYLKMSTNSDVNGNFEVHLNITKLKS